MPTRAPVACAAPGCPHRQPCSVHPSRRWADGARGRRMPAGWDATRRRILDRDGWTCRACSRYAAEVDHIIRNGGEHDANLQSLCAPCHRDKTRAEAARAKRASMA
jgi:5-methylcytosine-specific restriction protein A